MTSKRTLRLWQKAIAVTLLLLDLTGARVVAVSNACEGSRTFFGPALSFRAIAKVVTGQDWRQKAPHSFGVETTRYSARDLEFVQRDDRPAPVNILPPINITLSTERSRNRPLYFWKLPSDLDPARSPQLHSKN
jgi:hypothetical protein